MNDEKIKCTKLVTHQLFRLHIVQDSLSILAVVSALHDGEQQLGRIVLRVETQEVRQTEKNKKQTADRISLS